MKIKKFMLTALLGVIFSFSALQLTASAAEPDPNAFTPGGSGIVIDNVTEKNGKEFYTIKSENGNIFYLIVDRLRDTDNVYFLNAVTESDLMALAEKSGNTISPVAGENSGSGNSGQQQSEQEKPPTQNSGFDSNTATMIFVGIAVVAVGGLGFYLKIVKPKKNKKNDDDEFDEYEDSGADDFSGHNTKEELDDDCDSDDDTDNNNDDIEW